MNAAAVLAPRIVRRRVDVRGIVQGVGYPNPTQSHFDSMDIWQAGSPAALKEKSSEGWIGQALKQMPATPAFHLATNNESAPRALSDPDGNRVSLVPKGWNGIGQIGVRLSVRDLAAQRRFYVDALGLTEEAPGAFRAGEGVILVDEAADAPAEAPFDGPGWRYITFQIQKADTEHAHALAHGGREAMAPQTLGTIARISMVKDPAGNWIELSQRANLTGSLEPG